MSKVSPECLEDPECYNDYLNSLIPRQVCVLCHVISVSLYVVLFLKLCSYSHTCQVYRTQAFEGQLLLAKSKPDHPEIPKPPLRPLSKSMQKKRKKRAALALKKANKGHKHDVNNNDFASQG